MAGVDDLTSAERRLVLAAIWEFRQGLGKSFDQVKSEDAGDAIHEIETMDTLDSAARKLGGDPAKDRYGSAEH